MNNKHNSHIIEAIAKSNAETNETFDELDESLQLAAINTIRNAGGSIDNRKMPDNLHIPELLINSKYQDYIHIFN